MAFFSTAYKWLTGPRGSQLRNGQSQILGGRKPSPVAPFGIVLIATTIAVVWLSIGFHLKQEYAAITAGAERESGNLALAAEANVVGMIGSIDQAILFIRDAYISDPAKFDLPALSPDARAAALKAFEIVVVGPDGQLLASSGGTDLPSIGRASWTNADVLEDHHSDALFMSEPVLGTDPSTWSINFSRRIVAADGTLRGAVVVSLDSYWLTRLYDTLDIGHGALMLIGDDGIVRARASSTGQGTVQNIKSSDLFAGAMVKDHGVLRSSSPLDGVDRIVSFRQLAQYPLILSVALDAEEVYGRYFHDRRNYLIAGVALTLVSLAIGLMLLIQRRSLLKSWQTLSAAVENISQGLIMVDANQEVAVINRSAIALLELPPDLLSGPLSSDDLIKWQLESGEFAKDITTNAEFLAQAEIIQFDAHPDHYERLRPNGTILEVHTETLPDGGMVRTFTDITQPKRVKAELIESGRRLRTERNLALAASARLDTALDNMANGLTLWDASDVLTMVNQRFSKVYGFPPDLIRPGIGFREFLGHCVNAASAGSPSVDAICESRQHCMDNGTTMTATIKLRTGRVVSIEHRPMPGGGSLASYEDVTEREAAEAKMGFMARHDALTGVANRILFQEDIAAALRIGRGVALLCIDLDGFKDVNDAQGHPVGDALLRVVAQRLLGCVRDSDTVARLGGDEFAIVQAPHARREDAADTAGRIIEAVCRPYTIDGIAIIISVSVGIEIAPPFDGDADTMLKHADLALYQAKLSGGGAHCFFDPAMNERAQARRELEHEIRRALADDEFEVYFQPIVDIACGLVTGFEALLRWHHPQKGLIAAGVFIPIAEETGLIIPLGAWVLRRACADAVGWALPASVAVNVSAIQLRSKNLPQAVRAALAVTGLPPERLILEITETALLQDASSVSTILQELRALGVRIALDDFGTGYSSLSQLRSFLFDKIKIDKSFIDGIGSRPDSDAIVRAVIGLSDSLGIVTVAEGVERPEQMAWLVAEGCKEVQGYLLGRPSPAAEAALILAAAPRRIGNGRVFDPLA